MGVGADWSKGKCALWQPWSLCVRPGLLGWKEQKGAAGMDMMNQSSVEGIASLGNLRMKVWKQENHNG